MPSFLELVSYAFGWIYTICWSASFYPQPILNYRRGTTKGTTIEFPVVNVLGFLAYFIFNCAFLYSPEIRKQYAARNNGLTPTVRFNDLAFAAHAVVMSVIVLTQFWKRIWGLKKGPGKERQISSPIMAVIAGSFIAPLIVLMLVKSSDNPDPRIGWAYIDVVYTLSYVKVLITFVKYIPQVLTNYHNGSTKGWSIVQILFDFTGGVLSVSQLCIDSYLQGDWSGITGNSVKLLLGNVSVFFDIIFMVQHYIIYPKKDRKPVEPEEGPLLEGQPS